MRRQKITTVAAVLLASLGLFSATHCLAGNSSSAYVQALKSERRQLVSEIDGWMSSDYASSEPVQLRIKRGQERLARIDGILSSFDEENADQLKHLMSDTLHAYQEGTEESKSLLNQDTRTSSQILADGDRPSIFGMLGDILKDAPAAAPEASHRGVPANDNGELKVLPGNFHVSLPQYFEILADPPEYGLQRRNQIVFDELAQVARSNANGLSQAEEEEIVDIMRNCVARGRLKKGVNRFLVEAWLKTPMSSRYLDLTKEALSLLKNKEIDVTVPPALRPSGRIYGPADAPLIDHLLSLKNPLVDLEIAKHIITRPEAVEHPEWVEALTASDRGQSPQYLAEAKNLGQFRDPTYYKSPGQTPFEGTHPLSPQLSPTSFLFATPPARYPSQPAALQFSGQSLQAEMLDQMLRTLSRPNWITRHPDLLKRLLAGSFGAQVKAALQASPQGQALIEAASKDPVPPVSEASEKGPTNQSLAPSDTSGNIDYSSALQAARKISPNDPALPPVIVEWMKRPESRDYPEIIRLVFARGSDDAVRDFAIANTSEIFHQPGGAEMLVERKDPLIDQALAKEIARAGESPDTIELIHQLLDPSRKTGSKYVHRGGFVNPEQLHAGVYSPILEDLVSKPEWFDRHPEEIDWVLAQGNLSYKKIIAARVMSLPEATKHFGWIKTILAEPNDGYLTDILLKSLAKKPWFSRFKEISLLLNHNQQHAYWKALAANPDWASERPEDVKFMLSKNDPEINRLLAPAPADDVPHTVGSPARSGFLQCLLNASRSALGL